MESLFHDASGSVSRARRHVLNHRFLARRTIGQYTVGVAMSEKSTEMHKAPMRPMASGRSMSAPWPMPHASGNIASAVANVVTRP